MHQDLHFIDINEIIYDEEYKFSNMYFSDELNNSIKKFGVLNPIVISKKHNNYIILCGHNRYKIAKNNKISKIPVVEFNFNNYDFRNQVMLKSFNGEMNSISKLKFINIFYNKNTIDENLFKALKIPDKYKHLKNIKSIFEIDHDLFKYIDEKNYNFKIIDEIVIFKKQYLEFLISIVKLKNIKSNIVKEIIYLLSELQHKNIIPEYIKSEEKNIRKIENDVLNYLKKLNFSQYYEKKYKADEIINKYEQNGFEISLPEFFEGNSLKFEIMIQNENELSSIINKLNSIKKNDLKKIFQML